jgi:murein DD-endopeptidase MepM/ murein hydrolase activator NlpD
MSWTSVTDFVSKKFNEYKEEILDAKDLQDNQKKFNELYISKEKQIAMIAEAQWKEEVEKKKADSEKATSSGTTSGTATGNTVQEQTWTFFTSAGFSKELTAGIMGNIERESAGTWDPMIVEYGNNIGFGLFQWSFTRRTAIEAWLPANGYELSSVEGQLKFLCYEMEQSYYVTQIGVEMRNYGLSVGNDIWSSFKAITDIKGATFVFCWAMEDPAPEPKAAMSVRQASAQKFYDQFKDATFSSGGSSSSGLARPCSGGSVSSEYGPRTLNGVADNHLGIDIATTGGALAAASGTVVSASWHDSYGNYIVLDHGSIGGKNIKTLYAHLASMAVAAGNKVAQGQSIGVIGNTGNSFGVHLHFEVKINDVRTNPRDYVKF